MFDKFMEFAHLHPLLVMMIIICLILIVVFVIGISVSIFQYLENVIYYYNDRINRPGNPRYNYSVFKKLGGYLKYEYGPAEIQGIEVKISFLAFLLARSKNKKLSRLKSVIDSENEAFKRRIEISEKLKERPDELV